ncbi:hypothetical protein ACFC26_17375 [Kitasatospora purpeofusca]|uniref:hypothetical protein n=1 Tax=Kitasatospora purpeofusca TaxID=67352 RepID=UPI0035DA73A2
MSGERDTVVLPCAGAGSRLGLPIAKELVPVGAGRVALDHALDLLAPHAHRLRLVAVLGEGREATARHLTARCAGLGLPLAFCSQDDGLAESTGAVLSTAAWWGAATAVLLPDQVLARPAPRAVGDLLDLVHAGHRAAFLTSAQSDPDRLAVDGCLRLETTADHRLPVVADFADKPGPEQAQAQRFNAVWFAYAFARGHGPAFLDVLHRVTLRRPLPDTGLAPLLGAPALDVGEFTDLGTWPNLAATITGSTS